MLFSNNGFISDDIKGFTKVEIEEIKKQLIYFEKNKSKKSEIINFISSKFDLEDFNKISEYLINLEAFFSNYFEVGNLNELYYFLSEILSELMRIEQRIRILFLDMRNIKVIIKNKKLIEKIYKNIKYSRDQCDNLIDFVQVNKEKFRPRFNNQIYIFIESSILKKTSFILKKLPLNLEIWEPLKSFCEIVEQHAEVPIINEGREENIVFYLHDIISDLQESKIFKSVLIYEYINLFYSMGIFSINEIEEYRDSTEKAEIKKNLRLFLIELLRDFIFNLLLERKEIYDDGKIITKSEIKKILEELNQSDIYNFISKPILKIFEKIETYYQKRIEEQDCIIHLRLKNLQLINLLDDIVDWILEFEYYLKPYDEITLNIRKTINNINSEIQRRTENFENSAQSIYEEKVKAEVKDVIDNKIAKLNHMLNFYQQETSKTINQEFPELENIKNMLRKYTVETTKIQKEITKIFEDIRKKGVSPYSLIKNWENNFTEKTNQMKFALYLSISKLFISFKEIIGKEEILFSTIKNIGLLDHEIPLNYRFTTLFPEKLSDDELKERIQSINSQIKKSNREKRLYQEEMSKLEEVLSSRIRLREGISTSNVQCTVCHKYINIARENIIVCPFCGSVFHYLCVAYWISKYNACPMCSNQFLDPNLGLFEDQEGE